MLRDKHEIHSSSPLAPHKNRVFPAGTLGRQNHPSKGWHGEHPVLSSPVSSGSTTRKHSPLSWGCCPPPLCPVAGHAPPCIPSARAPSPVPPPSALPFLDKTMFQYWLFLVVASTQKIRRGTGLWGSFRFFCPPLRPVGHTPPSPRDPSTGGPFVPSTELP